MAIVRYTLETVPKPTKKDWDRVKNLKDEDIDYSDIPEITDFSKFRPWEERQMFKPVKVAVTCKLDADIVAWLKQGGKGYQTRMNTILREAMLHSVS
ncbi:BrnA antitoxin family protein [Treponema sp. TIM-1]|uniref:BrnA antitoxin family protein n=1 Tax=Treponema sp. TIM-1 TaxID=2898417 RepID=UPI0039805CB6